MRGQSGQNSHRILLGPKTALHMNRGPRACFLVFRDAEGILPPMPEGAPIELTGQGPNDISHDEAHSSPNRRVGSPARSKEVIPAVDPELSSDGAVDKHEDRSPPSACGGGDVRPGRHGQWLYRPH